MDTTIEDDAEHLSDNAQALAEIDTSLAALQAHQHLLLAENAKLRSNIEAKRVEHAPMRSLIPEICDLIFALAVEVRCSQGCAADIELSPLRESSPLTLAHTSTLNSAALDRPSSRFGFKIGVASAARWTPASPAKILNPGAVKDLIPYLNQIQSLSLHVHHTSLAVLFPRETVSQMSKLERLVIRHHGYILDEHEIGKVNAPHLRSLQLCDPSPFISMLSASLSNLKNLQVEKHEFWEFPRKVPDFLSSCTTLVEVSMTFPRNLYLVGPNPVFLPSVSRLSLEWRFPCNSTPIFSSVQAPQLRHLSLTHNNFHTTFSQEAVSTLQALVQSSPCLITLTLVGCNLISICELSSIFCHTPAIEELGLLNCHGTGRLLHDLTPAEWEQPDTWSCPKLERIKLVGVRDNDIRPLIDFARRRMRPSGSGVDEFAHYLKELQLDSRIPDFTTQGRLLILRGLSIITPSVKVVGPLDHIPLAL